MQRKTAELLLYTTYRRISALSPITRCAPCSRLYPTRHWSSMETPAPAPKVTGVESITDFSKYNPDEFGTLNARADINAKLEEMPEEDDDKVEFLIEDETGRKVRRSLGYYVKLIKKFIAERKIADAIDILEERMLKRDEVKPNYYVYNILITGCANVGYTQKAFKLYNQMKKRNIKRTPATYTALFNACANSLCPEDALIQVNNLRRQLEEQSIALNSINYHALIKAYARLNDIKAAFLVADEMFAKKLVIDEGTFSFLLQACASDKDAGFRHALILWHKMRRKFIKPNVFVFNQFLRCVRDCGIGDVNETLESVKLIAERSHKVISAIGAGSDSQSSTDATEEENKLPSATNDENEHSELDDLSLLEQKENRPNLLAPIPHLGSIIELKNVNSSSDRLLLLGGFRNILEEMERQGVKPDLKTFTILLDMIPSTCAVEEALMNEMAKRDIKMDIDFCNMLVKKRAYRRDYENGRAVLELIQANFLNPDIVTFGVLALCCKTTPEAKQLIRDMKQFGYRLNVEIIGGMLKQACCCFDYDYVMFLMKLTKKFDIQPSEKYMENLRILMSESAKYYNKKDNRKKNKPYEFSTKNFESYQMFRDYYKQWKSEVTVYKPPHPYKQFKVRFEPQNEEEEGLQKFKEESEPKISDKSKSTQNAPLKGPTKWRKPEPKVLDTRQSIERQRALTKNRKKIVDGESKEKNVEKVMQFEPFEENDPSEGVGSNSENDSLPKKRWNKIEWKRTDGKSNDSAKFDSTEDEEFSNNKKIVWKRVDEQFNKYKENSEFDSNNDKHDDSDETNTEVVWTTSKKKRR